MDKPRRISAAEMGVTFGNGTLGEIKSQSEQKKNPVDDIEITLDPEDVIINNDLKDSRGMVGQEQLTDQEIIKKSSWDLFTMYQWNGDKELRDKIRNILLEREIKVYLHSPGVLGRGDDSINAKFTDNTGADFVPGNFTFVKAWVLERRRGKMLYEYKDQPFYTGEEVFTELLDHVGKPKGPIYTLYS